MPVFFNSKFIFFSKYADSKIFDKQTIAHFTYLQTFMGAARSLSSSDIILLLFTEHHFSAFYVMSSSVKWRASVTLLKKKNHNKYRSCWNNLQLFKIYSN